MDRSGVEAVRDAVDSYDVADLLTQVVTPTLVMHRSSFLFPRVEVARRLAARIPDARLVILEGGSPAPFLGDTASLLQAIGDFIGEEFPAIRPVPADAGQAPVTILFTDLEGSTDLAQRRGDATAHEIVRAHNRIVRDALGRFHGFEIKHTGDGIMASFASASRALECSVEIQRGWAAQSLPAADDVRVRIGLNAGEPISDERDLFGTAVNLAARITAAAEAGEILASDVVRQLVAGKGFLFADRGMVSLRGFEDPVHLFEVGWQEAT